MTTYAFDNHGWPSLRISVDRAFDYVGDLTFAMPPSQVRRCVFVESVDGDVRRQLILQFEELVEAGRTYRWAVTNPLTLGGGSFQHDVYVWSVAQDIARAPGTEVDRTTAFLTRNRLVQDDGQLMSRFARVLGSERRRELIVFYQEALTL